MGWDMLGGSGRFMIGCDMSRDRSANLCSIPSVAFSSGWMATEVTQVICRSRGDDLCRQAQILDG